jgi:hypothetical protein
MEEAHQRHKEEGGRELDSHGCDKAEIMSISRTELLRDA